MRKPTPIKRLPVRKKFTKPSKAKQSFKAECNVNNIMKKYEKYGIIEHVNNHQAAYGDFSDVSDYQTSLNAVMAANDAFMELPAAIRKQFDNNPATFVAFVEDPNNQEKLIEMGLATAIPKTIPDDPEPAPKSEETETV